jgi:16S rRNA processing protein RimM
VPGWKLSNNDRVDPGASGAFVLLGTVVRPHGIRGELKICPHTEQPDSICRYQRVFLAADVDGEMIECVDIRARISGRMIILRLRGCDDRDRAERFAGWRLWLPTSELPPAKADEVYLHSLMDKRARTSDGRELGTIRELLGGGQERLVIRDGDREYLVPAVRAFIVSVGKTEVVLDLPPGLLEMNS